MFAGFTIWARAKQRRMAEILVEQGAIDPGRRAAIEMLVEQHLRMHDRDPGKSLAAIPVGRSTREGLARVADPEIDASLSVAGSTVTEALNDPERSYSLEVAEAAGDAERFRVLRPHAQGGLGAVFVALDGELHREVALKRIQERHADDPAIRARFLLEAEVTGGLEHPGIVPVYGLGTDPDGRPYYAMRLIRGDSLKDAIAAFHADPDLRRDPGAPRWRGTSCSGGSSTSVTRSHTRTAAASCTATSSRAT